MDGKESRTATCPTCGERLEITEDGGLKLKGSTVALKKLGGPMAS